MSTSLITHLVAEGLHGDIDEMLKHLSTKGKLVKGDLEKLTGCQLDFKIMDSANILFSPYQYEDHKLTQFRQRALLVDGELWNSNLVDNKFVHLLSAMFPKLTWKLYLNNGNTSASCTVFHLGINTNFLSFENEDYQFFTVEEKIEYPRGDEWIEDIEEWIDTDAMKNSFDILYKHNQGKVKDTKELYDFLRFPPMEFTNDYKHNWKFIAQEIFRFSLKTTKSNYDIARIHSIIVDPFKFTEADLKEDDLNEDNLDEDNLDEDNLNENKLNENKLNEDDFSEDDQIKFD